MNKSSALAIISLACTAMANGQVAMDWPTIGGDAQRTGWAKADGLITKENVKDFQLVLKRKFDVLVSIFHNFSCYMHLLTSH